MHKACLPPCSSRWQRFHDLSRIRDKCLLNNTYNRFYDVRSLSKCDEEILEVSDLYFSERVNGDKSSVYYKYHRHVTQRAELVIYSLAEFSPIDMIIDAIRHSNAGSRSCVRHASRPLLRRFYWFTYSACIIGGALGRRLGRSTRTRGRRRAAAIVESSPWHASRAQPVRKPTDRIHLSMKSIERSSLALLSIPSPRSFIRPFSQPPSGRCDVTALNK